MKTVTAAQMKEIENNFMQKTGIPSLILMENAAMAAADEVMKKDGIKKVCVVCSKGNNGGDGFAAARLLAVKEYDVKIVFIGKKEKASRDCLSNIEFAEKTGIEIIPFSESGENKNARAALNECDCIIDAIIGTGLSNKLRDDFLTLVDMINSAQKYVISIDCPTGINSDNGNVLSRCVRADKTVTFYLPKTGLFLFPAADYVGEIRVADITVSRSEKNLYNLNYNVLTDSEAADIIPERPANSHKGTFGKVGVFAGSADMVGAAVICTKAAYRGGCGLVYSFSAQKVSSVINIKVPEAVTVNLKTDESVFGAESLDDVDFDFINRLDCIAVGCGIGKKNKTAVFLKKLIQGCKTRLILDADALNIISEDIDILKEIKCPFAVTPHIAEMSRLTGKSIDDISNNMIDTALDFSQKYNAVTVLKSARTVIASPSGEVFINTTGNSSLAKGGSGDMLTGAAASLTAQTKDIFKACVLACFVNGRAAEYASRKFGEYGACADNISDCISAVLSNFQNTLANTSKIN